ncbi:Uncharacterised protein [Achromobacter sp. 2789STDY5608621]|nr:Uncharacterised protein [Achromobacter sp. 2789STDY5608621]
MAGGAFSGVAVLSFVGRPSGRRTRWRAPTIAVRSVRSGLPLPHPRCRLPAAAFGFPRAHRGCPPPGPPARGATDFEACRAARSVCRAWNLRGCPSRPGGRSRWASGQLKVGRVRCARVGSGFLLFPHVWGRGDGGRRGGKRVARDESLAPTTNSLGAGRRSMAKGLGAGVPWWQCVAERACLQWRMHRGAGMPSIANASRRWHACNEKPCEVPANLPKKIISPPPYAIVSSPIARHRVSLKRPPARPA